MRNVLELSGDTDPKHIASVTGIDESSPICYGSYRFESVDVLQSPAIDRNRRLAVSTRHTISCVCRGSETKGFVAA